MPYRLQDPIANPVYAYDWTDFLEEGGSPSDTLSTFAASIDPLNDGSPTEPAITDELISGNVTSCFVSGCAAGKIYRLSFLVTTGMGRRDEWSVTIRGGER